MFVHYISFSNRPFSPSCNPLIRRIPWRYSPTPLPDLPTFKWIQLPIPFTGSQLSIDCKKDAKYEKRKNHMQNATVFGSTVFFGWPLPRGARAFPGGLAKVTCAVLIQPQFHNHHCLLSRYLQHHITGGTGQEMRTPGDRPMRCIVRAGQRLR